MSERIFPEGLRAFPPRDNAPDFVVAAIIITPNDLVSFLKQRPELLTDYNGSKQLRLQLTRSKDGKGLNMSVDTYKPKGDSAPDSFVPKKDTDLPF